MSGGFLLCIIALTPHMQKGLTLGVHCMFLLYIYVYSNIFSASHRHMHRRLTGRHGRWQPNDHNARRQ